MSQSQNTTVRMSEASRKELSKVLKSHGMTQIEALGRVLTWFGEQSKTIQSMILGNLDKSDNGHIVDLLYELRQVDLTEDEEAAYQAGRALVRRIAAELRPQSREQKLGKIVGLRR